jgi:putative transposase
MYYRQRKQTRIKDFSYTAGGIYHIVIGTYDKLPLLGTIINAEMHLSEIGNSVVDSWWYLSELYSNIALDEYTIMPNHIHALLIIQGAGAYKKEYQHNQTLTDDEEVKELSPKICSIPDIVRDFKSYTSHLFYQKWKFSLWQRGYYEHIIRSDAELENARKYIRENIGDWKYDEYNQDSDDDTEKT